MTVLVVVLVEGPWDLDLARRPIAGRPWIARLIDRLRLAQSVSDVVVVCALGAHEIDALLGGQVRILPADDWMRTARDLPGAHDGVAFCPVRQYFADPDRLDDLASLPAVPGAARAFAVLSADPCISLSGGAFLQVLTREGLRIAADGTDLSTTPAMRLRAWPEPPEMRMHAPTDAAWIVPAAEALLGRDPSGRLDQFETTLDGDGLSRFTFWDGIGHPPRSVLTVRCLPTPLFAWLVRHLRRLPGAAIDVLCAASLEAETAAIPGVRRVHAFGAARFSAEAIGPDQWKAIRGAAYDLCVIPRREPLGVGLDNLTPLAVASGAPTANWLDITGQSGLLAGQAQGWDETLRALAPHEQPSRWLRRAVRALDDFADPRHADDAEPARLARGAA
jgi:hypothetical protein